METLKNFIYPSNDLQVIGSVLYFAVSMHFMKLGCKIYTNFKRSKITALSLAITVPTFQLDFPHGGKLDFIAAYVSLGIRVLIFSVLVATLAIREKIRKKKIENDESE